VKFFAALLLISCAPQWKPVQDTGSTVDTARVCLNVPNPDSLAPAIEIWNQALGSWRQLVVAKPYETCAYTVSLVQTSDVCNSPISLACADVLGGHEVYLVSGRYEADPVNILTHELGHLFGAQHVDGTLMNPTYGGRWTCPDVTTVVQVAAWYRISLVPLSWCY
jgi:hypothetical protein